MSAAQLARKALGVLQTNLVELKQLGISVTAAQRMLEEVQEVREEYEELKTEAS